MASAHITHFVDHEFTNEPEVVFEIPKEPVPNMWTHFTYPLPLSQPHAFRETDGGYIWAEATRYAR